MGDILFLSSRVPSPAARDQRRRSFQLLERLSELGRVHLAAFAHSAEDVANKPALARYVASQSILWRPEPGNAAMIAALAAGTPASVAAHHSARMAEAVRAALRARVVSAICVHSSEMAQYVPRRGRYRVTVDFDETRHAPLAASAAEAGMLRRLQLEREADLMLRYERSCARRANLSLFASAEAAAPFVRLLDGDRLRIVENGVDCEQFDPQLRLNRIEAADRLIVFAPSPEDPLTASKIEWLGRSVMPHVHARFPGTRLVVVAAEGAPPSRTLPPNVHLQYLRGTGDVRPWLAAASTVAVPGKTWVGTSKALLEAMAMGRPVVASAAVAAGVEHAGTIRVAGSVGEFADQLLAALTEGEAGSEAGLRARQQVRHRYEWSRCLEALDPLGKRGSSRVA